MREYLWTGSLLAGACLSLALGAPARATESADVVARVGGETITFSELNTMMNSSAVVGLSLPALGTAERNRAMLVLLDRAISANLLYLDARDKGLDRDPEYVRALSRFEEGVLAGLYRARYLVGDIPISEEDIKTFHETTLAPGTELTDDVRRAIEATIRKERFKDRVAGERERLRQDARVVVHKESLATAGDAKREDSVVVATVNDTPVTWGEVKEHVLGASARSTVAPMEVDEGAERLKAVQGLVDTRLMALKGRAAGLEADPSYRARVAEFRKTRLINLHRGRLLKQLEPTEAEVWAYYQDHRAEIAVPERRRVQMVVLKTKEEAEAVKGKIEAGEITIYEAASEHSIDPHAKDTLGEMGWVAKGTGFPELDALTFSLEPDKLGGPVESPAGWHLVMVHEVADGAYQDFDEPRTRREARRRLMHERIGKYTADLRRTTYPVVVYEDTLKDLFRREAEWIAAESEKAARDPQAIQKLLDEMRGIGGKEAVLGPEPSATAPATPGRTP